MKAIIEGEHRNVTTARMAKWFANLKSFDFIYNS